MSHNICKKHLLNSAKARISQFLTADFQKPIVGQKAKTIGQLPMFCTKKNKFLGYKFTLSPSAGVAIVLKLFMVESTAHKGFIEGPRANHSGMDKFIRLPYQRHQIGKPAPSSFFLQSKLHKYLPVSRMVMTQPCKATGCPTGSPRVS